MGVECAFDVISLPLAVSSACACTYECKLEDVPGHCAVSKKKKKKKKKKRGKQQAVGVLTTVFGEL